MYLAPDGETQPREYFVLLLQFICVPFQRNRMVGKAVAHSSIDVSLHEPAHPQNLVLDHMDQLVEQQRRQLRTQRRLRL